MVVLTYAMAADGFQGLMCTAHNYAAVVISNRAILKP